MTKFASCNSFTISPGVYTETSITTKQNSYACIWSTLWKTDSEALQLNAWMWFQDTENNISRHIIMIMVMNVMLNAKLSHTWSLLLCMHAIIFVWFLLFPDFACLFFNLKYGSCYINEDMTTSKTACTCTAPYLSVKVILSIFSQSYYHVDFFKIKLFVLDESTPVFQHDLYFITTDHLPIDSCPVSCDILRSDLINIWVERHLITNPSLPVVFLWPLASSKS